MRNIPLEKLQHLRRKRRFDQVFYAGHVAFIGICVGYALWCFWQAWVLH